MTGCVVIEAEGEGGKSIPAAWTVTGERSSDGVLELSVWLAVLQP